MLEEYWVNVLFCSINTVYYMAPYATMILAVPALALEGWGVVKWIEIQQSLFAPLLIIFLSGVSAFCLNFSIFYVIHATTAVTFNVAGNMKVGQQNPLSSPIIFIMLSVYYHSGYILPTLQLLHTTFSMFGKFLVHAYCWCGGSSMN